MNGPTIRRRGTGRIRSTSDGPDGTARGATIRSTLIGVQLHRVVAPLVLEPGEHR